MAFNTSKTTGRSVAGRSTGFSIAAFRNRAPVPEPPPKYYVKLFVVLPMPGHGFTELDLLNINAEEALEQIRRQFEVDLTFHDNGEMVEIKAINRAKANDALKAVRKMLERKAGDRVVWRPLALIKPLQGGNDHTRFALIPHEGLGGARAVAIAGPKPISKPRDAAESSHYRENLEKALARAVENLRYVPNRMRMRLKFGHVLLKEWKKGHSEYTFSELEQIAQRAGPRGTVHMHTHIGQNDTVGRIRKQLPLILRDCVPQDIRAHTAADTTPSISLMLLTKNLILESVVDAARGRSEIGSKEDIKYRYVLGPMTAFHREARARAVTIMTSCPQELFDWCLEVQSQVDDTKTALPFNDVALRENVVFKEARIADGFPPVNINPVFLKANQVDVIIGKVSWSYLINSRYVLEVGLYHQWRHNTTGQPNTGAVVSLYGADWDLELSPADISTGPRDWANFSDQFLKSDSDADDSDRLENLFSLVRQIQDILAKATQSDS